MMSRQTNLFTAPPVRRCQCLMTAQWLPLSRTALSSLPENYAKPTVIWENRRSGKEKRHGGGRKTFRIARVPTLGPGQVDAPRVGNRRREQIQNRPVTGLGC